MKRKLKRSIILFFCVLMAACAYPVGASAATEAVGSVSESNVTPRVVDIVIKYRTYNGRLQYRRWDQMGKTWIDPDWIYV